MEVMRIPQIEQFYHWNRFKPQFLGMILKSDKSENLTVATNWKFITDQLNKSKYIYNLEIPHYFGYFKLNFDFWEPKPFEAVAV